MTGNAILDTLTAFDCERAVVGGDMVPLESQQVLYDFNTTVNAVWFPMSGVISWTTRDLEGHFVETTIGGREAFIRVQVLLAADSMTGHAEVQARGQVPMIEASRFQDLVLEILVLLIGTHRFTLALVNQMAQLFHGRQPAASHGRALCSMAAHVSGQG